MEELKQKFYFWHERRTNCSLLTGVEFFRASNAASQWLIQYNSTTSESDRNQDFMTLISMELHRPVPEKFALPVVCFRSIKTHFFMNGCIAYYSCRKWNLPVLEICIHFSDAPRGLDERGPLPPFQVLGNAICPFWRKLSQRVLIDRFHCHATKK